MKKKRLVDFNAPVILLFTFISFAILLLSIATKGLVGEFLAAQRGSWVNPLTYLRLFTHAFTHMTFEHYTGNIMLILAIGPMVEEKYGSRNTLFMILATAFITGLFSVLVFSNTLLLGASGIVFMFILLASFANIREGTIPLTVILVAIFYIGNEIIAGLTVSDNISHTSHILGGVCGSAFGYILNNSPKQRRRER